MCHLIINKNLDPPCKTTSNTHLFGEKKKRERETTRIVLDLTNLQFLLLSRLETFVVSSFRSKTIERGNGLRERVVLVDRQKERETWGQILIGFTRQKVIAISRVRDGRRG